MYLLLVNTGSKLSLTYPRQIACTKHKCIVLLSVHKALQSRNRASSVYVLVPLNARQVTFISVLSCHLY
jgi:hypothetical protein